MMHHEASNGHSLDDTLEASVKKIDKKTCNDNRDSIPISINLEQNTLTNSTITNENVSAAAHGNSATLWKPSSRRCSSDGAIKITQKNGIPKPERGHSFSDSDEKTAALKAKIHQKFDELEKEMAAKACANGLVLAQNSAPSSEAVLQLGDKIVPLLSPDPR